MINRLAHALIRNVIRRRAPDFVVGPAQQPYLFRWWLIPRNRYFNIYLHNIRRSDSSRALHDHPWPSLSYMVAGELLEILPNHRDRYIKAGQWIYRPAHYMHRLEVFDDFLADASVWTIFVTGPKIREWGFACPVIGWRHWKEFGDPDNGNGKGCDP